MKRVSDNDLVSKLDLTQRRIKNLDLESEKLRQEYNKIEKELYRRLGDKPVGSHIEGVSKIAIVNKVTVCSIKDWKEFLEYIIRTGNFSLLHKNPNNKEYVRFLNNNVQVPGAQPYKRLGIKLIDKEK